MTEQVNLINGMADMKLMELWHEISVRSSFSTFHSLILQFCHVAKRIRIVI